LRACSFFSVRILGKLSDSDFACHLASARTPSSYETTDFNS
jgi:hypothetical protein